MITINGYGLNPKFLTVQSLVRELHTCVVYTSTEIQTLELCKILNMLGIKHIKVNGVLQYNDREYWDCGCMYKLETLNTVPDKVIVVKIPLEEYQPQHGIIYEFKDIVTVISPFTKIFDWIQLKLK